MRGGGGGEEPFVGMGIQDQRDHDGQFRFGTVDCSLACVLFRPTPPTLPPPCLQLLNLHFFLTLAYSVVIFILCVCVINISFVVQVTIYASN